MELFGLKESTRGVAGKTLPRLGFQNRVEPLGGLGLSEFFESARLKLPDAFSRESERLTNLLKGVLFLAGETVSESQDQLLSRRKASDQISHS